MTDHKRTYSQRGDDYLIEAQRLRAEDKPKPPVMCPYCGHKMVHQYVYGDHFFRCPKCRSKAPDKDTEAEAYEAAMQRYVEPNKVLTLDEMQGYCKKGVLEHTAWLEMRYSGNWYWVIFYPSVYHLSLDTMEAYIKNRGKSYNLDWRCWLRKPTQEEMEGVPWEGD